MATETEGGMSDGMHVFPMHVFQVRVYYEDTDNGGVVYYANYLKFAERARTEMLRAAGHEHGPLMDRDGIAFAVQRCEIEYLAPARLDDLLEVHTGNLEIGGASLWADQVVKRGGDALVRMRLRLACVSRSGRPARLPEQLRAALRPLARREAAEMCEDA
jgi:acyl-CoA thioester hydrolase